jgi:sugar phosphate isomerase/epimerase
MNRRTFFAGWATLAVGNATASAAPAKAPAGKPLPFKISLAQWSLHRAIRAKEIDNLDFAKIANGFGIDAIEYVNQFFKDKARDRTYLADMKRRAAGEGVWSALIMVDGEGKLGDADDAKRRKAVDDHQKWLEAASFLGCHSIRVNAHADGTPEEAARRVTDGLRRLSELGDGFGLNVIVENHGGLSSDGGWLTKVIRAVGHPRCGTLPDFGNFKIADDKEYDRYKGVEEMMPFAKAVSAKSHAFDKRGNESATDYDRMMKIVTAAGYHGYVGIEYEGETLPERDGILATKKLLERVRTKLTT